MTLEERADELYSDEGLAVESKALNSLCKKGYISGAIDQIAIDIEKACFAHCKLCDCSCKNLYDCDDLIYIKTFMKK